MSWVAAVTAGARMLRTVTSDGMVHTPVPDDGFPRYGTYPGGDIPVTALSRLRFGGELSAAINPSRGTLYIGDALNHRVVELDP